MNTELAEATLGLERLSQDALKRVRSHFLIASIVGVVVGLVLLIWPDKSLAVGVTVMTVGLSIFFLAVGVARVLLGITAPGMSGWVRVLMVLIGILLVACGFIGLGHLAIVEIVNTIIFVLLLAVAWISEGLTALAESGRGASQVWSICYAIVSILAGISLILAPLAGALTLVWVSGILLVIGGVAGAIRAIQLKKLIND